MIWIALAVMLAICWWNNNRFGWYLDNVETNVAKKLAELESEIKKTRNEMRRLDRLEMEHKAHREELKTITGHLERLLDEPSLRSREVAQAALDYLMRRHR